MKAFLAVWLAVIVVGLFLVLLGEPDVEIINTRTVPDCKPSQDPNRELCWRGP